MSRRVRLWLFVVSTPLVALIMVGGLLGAVRTPVQQGLPHLRVFEDVVRLIVGAYVEPPDMDKVMDGAMRGLADGLDGSTSYLSPDEVRAIDARTALPAGDVGIVLDRQYYLRVVGVRDGSPADRAGLESGDFIRAIDGTPTRDMSAYAGARRLRGAPGSKVALLIIRNGNTADPRSIDVVREVPAGDRATSRRLPGGEAYLRISSFGSNTAEAVGSAVTRLGEAARAGLIVDVRGTADGTADDAVAAARLFVKSGPLATRAGRGPDRDVTSAEPGDGALTMPVVLLVSNGTGNAAEIFAAALADNNRATLVGERTAGLAGIQQLVRLPDDSGLWMTTAQYVRANGDPIHAHGLSPDVPVDVRTVGFDETPPATDAALDSAVKTLHTKEATTK
jgi:carboxyl-terminal processing protease